MKCLLILIVLASMSLECAETKGCSDQDVEFKVESDDAYAEPEEGFVLVDIGDIYHNGGKLIILSGDQRDTLLHIIGTRIKVMDSRFDVIDQEHLYYENVNVEHFDPEYGLFILSCLGRRDGFYEVVLNEDIVLISKFNRHVRFKGFADYILDAYPVPTKSNPLRKEPSDLSPEVSAYEDYTYVPVEVEGDWVRVKDDKDCYMGENPASNLVEGWIKWREEARFVLKVAFFC